jgi:hypothetical protein
LIDLAAFARRVAADLAAASPDAFPTFPTSDKPCRKGQAVDNKNISYISYISYNKTGELGIRADENVQAGERAGASPL